MARAVERRLEGRSAAPFTDRGRLCGTLAAVLLALSGGRAGGDDATASVALRWLPVAGAVAYEVEIAADAAFGRIVVRERTTVTGYRWRTIPADRHFWRVRGLDDRGRAGRWSEVRVIEAALRVPELLAPGDGARVVLDTDARTVLFSWRPSEVMREYVLEMAADPGFAGAREAWRGRASSVRLRPPAQGRFHWRVRGVSLAGQETPPSAPRSLVVEPGVPAARAPEDGGHVPWGPVELAWDGPPGVSRWRVTVRPPGGAEPMELESGSSAMTFRPTAAGEHGWEVRALLPDGSAGEASARRRFLVDPRPPLSAPRPTAPAPGALLDDGDASAPVSLAWDPVPEAAAYEVQLAETAEGLEGAAPRGVPEAELRIPGLQPGSWIWRVRALRSDGDRGAWSEPSAFRLGAPPPAPVPPPVTASTAEWGRLRAGVRVGWRSNLLRVSGLVVGAELSLRTPALAGRLLLAARGELQTASATVPPQPGIASPTEASARLFPVALLAIYEVPLGAWALYAGGGPALVVARFAVGPDAGLSAAMAADAVLGAERPLGPGSAFLELGARLGRIDGTLGRIRTGGLGLAAGYRY